MIVIINEIIDGVLCSCTMTIVQVRQYGFSDLDSQCKSTINYEVPIHYITNSLCNAMLTLIFNDYCCAYFISVLIMLIGFLLYYNYDKHWMIHS